MYVFNGRRKIGSDGAVATSSDSSFHVRDPKTWKVRPPTTECLKVGTTKRLVLADRTARRQGRSGIWTHPV